MISELLKLKQLQINDDQIPTEGLEEFQKRVIAVYRLRIFASDTTPEALGDAVVRKHPQVTPESVVAFLSNRLEDIPDFFAMALLVDDSLPDLPDKPIPYEKY